MPADFNSAACVAGDRYLGPGLFHVSIHVDLNGFLVDIDENYHNQYTAKWVNMTMTYNDYD